MVAVRSGYERTLSSAPACYQSCLPVSFARRFDVESPQEDHFLLIPLFHRIHTGEAECADFFAQHKGVHRVVFPKLLLSALAFASNWRITYEVYWSIGLREGP